MTPTVCTIVPPHLLDRPFWDGARRVIGDGDGQIFHDFTRAVDVIGQELPHLKAWGQVGVTAS